MCIYIYIRSYVSPIPFNPDSCAPGCFCCLLDRTSTAPFHNLGAGNRLGWRDVGGSCRFRV